MKFVFQILKLQQQYESGNLIAALMADGFLELLGSRGLHSVLYN